MKTKSRSQKVNHRNIVDFCYKVNEATMKSTESKNLMVKRISIQSMPFNYDSENVLYGISSC